VGFILFVLSYLSAAYAQPRCWEGELTIPTYPWGEDINPKFQELEDKIFYPYPLQDVLSSTKEDRTYKALYLENEYLKVTCLPELGGRIHSVLDKTTGQEMFHKNNVIKPGLIGLRGAWIAGGIEWNTGPHGHTVTIVSPVDAMVMENEDGSVTLVVGNTEKIFRTRWTVKVTLHPGRSYLEEDIRIFNPTDGVHPYYFWNCTAFPCLPGTRFIFPMSLGCDHDGKDFFNWPIHEGKDLTWLKNYDRPTSIFAYECDQDFFGAYDVDLDRGIVAVADHHVLPGKKAWTWGQSDDGRVSQQALTDEDGPYIEVQSGPLRTQADYGLLYPREEVHWREWWYPVHGLGEGFGYANKDVVVQTVRDGKGLELSILATGSFPGSRIVATQGGKILFEGSLDIGPNGPVSVTVTDATEGPVKVSLLGNEFITPLPIPQIDPPGPSWMETKKEQDMTVEELYLMGLEEDKRTNRSGARDWYHKALAKDASHVASLRALAVLDLESGLYEEAAQRLEQGLIRDPGDAWSWFFLGSAKLRLGSAEEALSCGQKCARLMSSSSVGNDLVGRSLCNIGSVESISSFREAMERNNRDVQAMKHLLFTLSMTLPSTSDLASVTEEMDHLGEVAVSIDPLDPMVLYFSPSDSRPAAVSKVEGEVWPMGQVGEKDFAILESCFFMNEIRGDDMMTSGPLFAYTSSLEKPSSGPTYAYNYFSVDELLGPLSWAWEGQVLPATNQEELQKLLTQKAVFPINEGQFPSRPEAIPYLTEAIEENNSDYASHYHLGNLLAGLHRTDEAVPHWEKAAELNPKLSVPLRNLGLYAWKKEKDFAKAQDYYRRAIAARPSDDTLYRDLARILVEDEKRPEAIAVLESYPLEKVRRNDLVEDLGKYYAEEERYDDAIALLSGAWFSNWEGRTASHNTWVKAHLERGRQRFETKDFKAAMEDFRASLTYPERLGVGRPAEVEEAERLYWVGKALSEIGNYDEALATWLRGTAGKEGSDKEKEYRAKCKEAIEEAGR
jgi:tetratricopeptide (TPR) repeat protein